MPQPRLHHTIGHSVRRAARLAAVGLSALAGVLACAALLGAIARPAGVARAAPAAPAALNYPGCGASLQACIDGAAVGDTIVISAGTYVTSFTLHKPVSLTGVSSATVLLQALPGQRALTVTGAPITYAVMISGLTFMGGNVDGGTSCPANCGGGVLITDTAEPTLLNIAIVGNRAWRGGGVYAHAGTELVLASSLISGNISVNFGGGGFAWHDAVLISTRFYNNRCSHVSCLGGGFFANNTLLMSNSQFISNTARAGGGGLRTTSPAHMLGGLFRDNHCTEANCWGGGLYSNSSAFIEGTQFYSNTARQRGGGAFLAGAAALTGGQFTANHCIAPDCQGGALYAAGTLAVTGTHFVGSSALGNGGAVQAGGAATLNGAVFTSNQCVATDCLGGGLHANSALTITGAQFMSNTARYGGGAVYANGVVSVTQSEFWRNLCQQDDCIGAGLHALGALDVSSSLFVENESSGDAGGVYAGDSARLHQVHFQDNACLGETCWGGGMQTSRQLTLTASVFTGNNSRYEGGGLHLGHGHAVIVNNLFADNFAPSAPAIYLGLSASLAHNTIVAASQVTTAAIVSNFSTVGITNTIIANHAMGILQQFGSVSEDYNLFSNVPISVSGGVAGGANSITGTAAFVNPALGDYRLTAASDAIDNGADAGVTVDFEGQPRPNGGGFDIGFDEFWPDYYKLFLSLVRR